MFISTEDILDTTGHEVSSQVVNIAQLMIETWIGRAEVEIEDASDLAILARATLFQAIYLGSETQAIELMEQSAVKSIVMNDSTTVFDTDKFAPYISPYAIEACKRLSWKRSRTVKTGPLFDRMPAVRWVEE